MIRRSILYALAGGGLLVVALASLGGCAVLTPLPAPTTLDERLGVFPTEDLPVSAPVEIRWNEHQVPFISAETDGDAAFALGLVHAHLRLGQMEVLRMISEGRLAEMAGPPAAPIDAALKTIDFRRAVPAIEAQLPDETRLWLTRFVEGINHYADGLKRSDLPHEMKVLGLKRRPWAVADVLALGRVAGSDVTWFGFFALLPFRDSADWDKLWADYKRRGESGLASFSMPGGAGEDNALAKSAALVNALGKSGSNSMVVGPDRSKTGGALIANDPHLGFAFPNIWLIAGIRSPSYTVAGAMLAGAPVIGFGRNREIAWGGTNLKALSTDLVDVSGLAAEAFTVEKKKLRVRFWRDRTLKVRLSPYGPVLSDVEAAPSVAGRPYALRWMGHEISDETTALLNVMKASSLEGFVEALEDFAIPGQNYLFAGADGRIAHVLATRAPKRGEAFFEDVLLTPEQSDAWWDEIATVSALPMVISPPGGVLGSANNRPVAMDEPVAAFFPKDERIRRIAERLDAQARFDLQDLLDVQHDTRSLQSAEVNAALLAQIDLRAVAADAAGPWGEALALLRAWEGDYEPDSRAALLHEALYGAFSDAYYAEVGRVEEFKRFGNLGMSRGVLVDDLQDPDPASNAAGSGS
ncbi:MAG: penicillin acylase family protein [Pseudomonadota bacterium]